SSLRAATHSPATSRRRSAHLPRTALGNDAVLSATIFCASSSATATAGNFASIALGPEARGAEAGNAVDGDDHREGDDQHAEPDHRDGAEVAALVEVVDEHRDHLGLRGEQD